MIDATAVVAYQLGIRFEQCQYMASDCMTNFEEQLCEAIEPRYLALSRYATARVREAVQAFAARATGCEELAQLAMSQLKNLDGLWVSIEQWNNQHRGLSQVKTYAVEQALNNLHEILAELVDRHPSIQNWFELGHTICDGYMDMGSERPSPADVGPTTKPTKKPTTKSQPCWRWNGKETLQELLTAVRHDIEELCPSVDATPEIKQLLPYDTCGFWMWFRIEVGLRQVFGLCAEGPSDNVQAPISVESSLPQVQEPFIPTATQKKILKVLDGNAMTADALAAAVGLKERRRLYGRGGNLGMLDEMIAAKLIVKHKRIGYYRPDAPPPEYPELRPKTPPTAP